MDTTIYQIIIDDIRNYRGLPEHCMKMLTNKFPRINYDTLYSIFSLEYQKRMKCNHIKSPANLNKYWELYQKALEAGEQMGIIVRMSVAFDLTPCLIGKSILVKYLESLGEEETTQVNSLVRNTSLIRDKHLAQEILLCTLYDNLYSPICESMKHSLGQQYEIKLHNEAIKLGLAFRTEEHLRKYGYDKTPDIKLDVPVAVDGIVINWIESKALFGDTETHREYVKNQYLSYWNRFGPGLVIYWFGYPACLLDDKRFIIRDHLPGDIMQMSAIK